MFSACVFFFMNSLSLTLLKTTCNANPIMIPSEAIDILYDKECYTEGDPIEITLRFHYDYTLQDPDSFEVYIYRPEDSVHNDYREMFVRQSPGVWKSSGAAVNTAGNRVVVARANFDGNWICRVDGFSVQQTCPVANDPGIEIEWDKTCYRPGDSAEITVKFYSGGSLVNPQAVDFLFRQEDCTLANLAYTVTNPQTGVYKLSNITMSSTAGQRMITAHARINGGYAQSIESVFVSEQCESENTCPSVTLSLPSHDITISESDKIKIQWDGIDPDDDANVALYYDTDANFENGGRMLIISNLAEDGYYNWSTNGVPAGSYYIVGVISDGECSDHAYASGKVTVYSAFDGEGLGTQFVEKIGQCSEELFSLISLGDSYDDGWKHLIYLKASLVNSVLYPFHALNVTFFLDLDDLLGITPEGRDGWVTCWIDGEFGYGISDRDAKVPIGLGMIAVKREIGIDDPRRQGAIKIFGGQLFGIEVNAVQFLPGKKELDTLNCGLYTGAELTLLTTSWNLIRGEIKKNALLESLGNAIKAGENSYLRS